MHYAGGKSRQGSKIAEYVIKVWHPGVPYYEPFCGALGAAHRVLLAMIEQSSEPPDAFLSDRNDAVINMWKAVLSGWTPPSRVTKEEYDAVRKGNRDPNDPITAFYGHCQSLGSSWFSAYGTNQKGINIAASAQRTILMKGAILSRVKLDLEARDYQDVKPNGAVVYLDPPYADVSHKYRDRIDHEEFWKYAESLLTTNTVLVTEFKAPDDWIRIYSWGDTTMRHGTTREKRNVPTESIFVHESQLHLWNF